MPAQRRSPSTAPGVPAPPAAPKKNGRGSEEPRHPPGKPSQPGHTLTVVHRVAERARADHALGFVCQGEGAAHLGGAVQLKGGVVGGDAVGAGDPRGGGGSGAHCKEKEGERQGQSGDRGGEEGLGAVGGRQDGERKQGSRSQSRGMGGKLKSRFTQGPVDLRHLLVSTELRKKSLTLRQSLCHRAGAHHLREQPHHLLPAPIPLPKSPNPPRTWRSQEEQGRASLCSLGTPRGEEHCGQRPSGGLDALKQR